MTRLPHLSQKRRVYVVESHALAARYLTTIFGRDPALEVILSGLNPPTDARLSSESAVLIVDADAFPVPVVPYLRTVRTLFADPRVPVIGKGVSGDELCRLLFQGVGGFVSFATRRSRAPLVSLLGKADRRTHARYYASSGDVRKVASGLECAGFTARCRRGVPVCKAACGITSWYLAY